MDIETVDNSSLWFGVTWPIISQVKLGVHLLWHDGLGCFCLPLLPFKIVDLGRF